MDQRDAVTWIAVELNRFGEARVEDGSLERLLQDALEQEHPVFIPAVNYVKGGKTITLYLMQGYVFVGSGLPETKYFALENQPYVAKVLSSKSGPHRMRTLSTIENDYIEGLRSQIRSMVASDIASGDWVRVSQGRYKTLEGRVTGVEQDHAYVSILLRSLKVIATIPKVFLELCEHHGED